MVKFLGCLGVEGGRCPASGVGKRHVQCTPVTRHGDRLTRPRCSALSTKPVSVAFSTPKHCASSAIPRRPKASTQMSLA